MYVEAGSSCMYIAIRVYVNVSGDIRGKTDSVTWSQWFMYVA